MQSTRAKQKQGNPYILVGNLTIKGKTNEVTLPFTYFGTRENPLEKGKRVADLNVFTVIKYSGK